MKISIIGCGNMGSAFAERLSSFHQLFLYDHHQEKCKELEKKGFGKACAHIKEALTDTEMVILAVKPQNLEQIASLIDQDLKKTALLVSLLAGTSLSTLKQYFPKNRLMRMMPNLAILCGQGILSLCVNDDFSQKDKEDMTRLFSSLGHVYWISEEKKDALTALSGSGPAFFLAIFESMVEAGIMLGFSSEESQKILSEMIQGTLSLLEYTHKHPTVLKWQITSPQGTTIAGLKKFEEEAIHAGIMNTFLAAFERSLEISRSKKQ